MVLIAEYTKEQFIKIEYESKDKEKILSYFKKYEPVAFTSEPLVDMFSDKQIKDADNCYTDGFFTWYDSDIYYFEHYNLKLDEKFIKKILS